MEIGKDEGAREDTQWDLGLISVAVDAGLRGSLPTAGHVPADGDHNVPCAKQRGNEGGGSDVSHMRHLVLNASF